MKVTRHAKRCWFTPQNHARIRWNTAFSRFTVGVSGAFIEALDVGNKIRDFVQNHLRETFAQTVLRPVIHKIIAAPPIDYPVNLFEIDKAMPKGGLDWSECEATCLSPLQAPPPDTPDTAQPLPPA